MFFGGIFQQFWFILILVFLSREVIKVGLMLVSNSSVTEIAVGSAFERKCIHSKHIPDCLFYKCWSSCSRFYFSKASHLAEELKNRKKTLTKHKIANSTFYENDPKNELPLLPQLSQNTGHNVSLNLALFKVSLEKLHTKISSRISISISPCTSRDI